MAARNTPPFSGRREGGLGPTLQMAHDALAARRRRGLLIVVSAPSGAGKTTLCKALLADDPMLVLSVSATTRPRRESECHGVDYVFMEAAGFEALLAADGFLEHAYVYGNLYGTPYQPVENALAAGKDVLIDCDWQGQRQIARRMQDDLVSIFILPPSAEELARRLTGRGEDPAEVIECRMAQADEQISHWIAYDHVVVNDDVARAAAEIRAIRAAARSQVSRAIRSV